MIILTKTKNKLKKELSQRRPSPPLGIPHLWKPRVIPHDARWVYGGCDCHHLMVRFVWDAGLGCYSHLKLRGMHCISRDVGHQISPAKMWMRRWNVEATEQPLTCLDRCCHCWILVTLGSTLPGLFWYKYIDLRSMRSWMFPNQKWDKSISLQFLYLSEIYEQRVIHRSNGQKRKNIHIHLAVHPVGVSMPKTQHVGWDVHR